MAILAFSAAEFRAQFPGQFLTESDAILELYWDTAVCYVSPDDSAGIMSSDCRRTALNLMTAHLITVAGAATIGMQSGFIESGTIDKVSVNVQAYPPTSQYQWFFNQTPYGVQLYALLSAQIVGGLYVDPFRKAELGSFRRAGGEFFPSSGAEQAALGTDKCSILTRVPPAPFDFDLGTILASSGLTSLGVSVKEGCEVLSIEFATVADSLSVLLSLWTGISVDTGNRINLYYWNGDDRLADTGPTLVSTNIDPTGLTLGVGFNVGILSGLAVNSPNLIVLTGFQNDSLQVLNVGLTA